MKLSLAERPAAPALDPIYDFADAITNADLAAAASCFASAGCLVTPDGTAIHGRWDIAAILAQMIAQRMRIETEQLVVRTAGDVALVSGHLTMHSRGPGSTRFVQAYSPTVATLKREGTWRIAVLAPWIPYPSGSEQ